VGDCCAGIDVYGLRLKVKAALSSVTLTKKRHALEAKTMQGDVAPSADISARCYPCLLFGFPKFSNNRTGPSIWEGPLCNKLPTSVAGEEYTALSSCVCLTDRLVQPAARFEELFCALVQLLQTRNLHSGI